MIERMTDERLSEIEGKERGFPQVAEMAEVLDELHRCRALLSTPQIEVFLEAVRAEAAHQRERWGDDHDAGKTDADFMWTLGWLAGKAVHATTKEKRLHHIITSAALCLNWHRLRSA